MQEQLISFEIAKLAKEKKFNIHCRFYYDEENEELYENEDFPYNSFNESLFAPTQTLLQKWLREIYKKHISIYPIKNHWEGDIRRIGEKVNSSFITEMDDKHFDTYEEALEKGLQEALKLI